MRMDKAKLKITNKVFISFSASLQDSKVCEERRQGMCSWVRQANEEKPQPLCEYSIQVKLSGEGDQNLQSWYPNRPAGRLSIWSK